MRDCHVAIQKVGIERLISNFTQQGVLKNPQYSPLFLSCPMLTKFQRCFYDEFQSSLVVSHMQTHFLYDADVRFVQILNSIAA